MKRTLKHTSLPLPAIKLILAKEPKKGTAVHIGWKNEDGKAFCLCGHEVGVANTSGRWEEVTINTHPDITCGRCKRIWNSNRTRNVDEGSPRWNVMNRIEREHLKSEYITNGPSYKGDDVQHPLDETHLNIKYGPYRFDRKLPCGETLIGIAKHYEFSTDLPIRNTVVHLASNNKKSGLLVPMCSEVYAGPVIGDTKDEYEEYPYITCPTCIQYIKDHDLDASKDEMEKRRIELAEKIARINTLTEELEAEKELCEELASRTIVIIK